MINVTVDIALIVVKFYVMIKQGGIKDLDFLSSLDLKDGPYHWILMMYLNVLSLFSENDSPQPSSGPFWTPRFLPTPLSFCALFFNLKLYLLKQICGESFSPLFSDSTHTLSSPDGGVCCP